MASNAGKRLDRLEKLLDSIATKSRQYHFVIIQPGETFDERLESLFAGGTIHEGDECQPVEIPWTVKPLKGSTYIPEGSLDDPLADPLTRKGIKLEDGYEVGVGLPATASSPALDPLPTHEQQERWRKHEQQIERDGQRYKGPSAP
jgi:hypothetical protein